MTAEDGALLMHVMPHPRYIVLMPPALYIPTPTSQKPIGFFPLIGGVVCIRDFTASAGKHMKL